MIKLYGFGPGVEQPDPSPFVMKVMILLRMAGLPFEDRRHCGCLQRPTREAALH